MITIRKSNERGHANHGWLNSNHTFSFADYYDPKYMGEQESDIQSKIILKMKKLISYKTGSFGCSDMILVASRSGKNGSITINQDVDMYVAKAQDAGEKVLKTFKQRHTWVQVVKGEVKVEGPTLITGDGAAIDDVEAMKLQWTKDSEFLVFDLP